MKVLAMALLQMYFGGGDVSEVIKDGGEAPHAKELGDKGDVSIDAEGVDEVPFCQRTEKSRENAPKLIWYIF
jgi:hypothetical protein